MAFPLLSEEGFELGTRGAFDATADTESKLTFPHYSTLAATPGLPMPYRGAYAMMIDLSKGTADAYVQETGAWDSAATVTIFFRFYVWFGAPRGYSVTMADTDIFSIFQLWSGATTVEASLGIQYTTANGYRFCLSELASGASGTFTACQLNQWNLVEIKAVIDAGGGNDGTLDAWINGSAMTQITGLDQGAITSGVLGAVSVDAGTTRGVLAFDEVCADDARIYGVGERFPETVMVRASQHVFVGPGTIENISLLSGAGTDNVVSVFDTDEAETNDATRVPVELKNTANSELVDPAGMPIRVTRGAYVQLAGTNPRSIVKVGRTTPAYGSAGAMRQYAAKRQKRVT